MKLINSSFEIIEQQSGLEGIYNHIELAGRTCYKSKDKITESSAKPFVDRMIKSGHGAMLEHGTVYLMIPDKEAWDAIGDNWVLDNYGACPYSVINCDTQGYYITTNYRVLVENGWLDDLKYLCEPTEHHEKRVTVRLTTDQGILREITRHRVFSYAVESTRYCNYSKDKFNNEITYILPSWIDRSQLGNHNSYEIIEQAGTVKGWAKEEDISELLFLLSLAQAEQSYLGLLNLGWKPQQARNVLPLATKCDIVMTGFILDWEHFFRLRSSIAETGAPHPDMVALIDPLYKDFINRGYIDALQ